LEQAARKSKYGEHEKLRREKYDENANKRRRVLEMDSARKGGYSDRKVQQ
jgi:hypothetical protein